MHNFGLVDKRFVFSGFFRRGNGQLQKCNSQVQHFILQLNCARP